MSTTVPNVPQSLLPGDYLARIRQAITLLAAIRNITEPPTSADGLKQSISLVLQLAELVGVDPNWIDRATQLVDDPAIFNIMLAVVQYLARVAAQERLAAVTNLGAGEENHAQSISDWLPLLLELLNAILSLRGIQ